MDLGINTDKGELESIYDGDLKLKDIIKNPILKPISEINKSYENLESGINRALFEYQEKYNKIKELLNENPKYGETMLVTIIISMLEYVKQIIHSQDLQKQNMKDAINEMLEIVEEEYMQVSEDEEDEESLPQEKKIPIPIKREDNKEDVKEEIVSQKEVPIPKVEEKEIIQMQSEVETGVFDKLSEIAETPEESVEEDAIEEKAEEEEKEEYHSDLLEKNISIPGGLK